VPPHSQELNQKSQHHIYSPSLSYPVENTSAKQSYQPSHPSKSSHIGQNFYGNRFSPYGGLLTPKRPNSNVPGLNHEQLTAASFALQNSFNPFNPEAFYHSMQSQYLSPGRSIPNNFTATGFNNSMAAKIAIQNTLSQYPIFKNAFNLGIPSFLSSPVSANVSSTSSGYSSTSDETSAQNTSNESIRTESAEDVNSAETTSNASKLSTAHIMNWIKNEPSSENCSSEATTKTVYTALKWARSQKNLNSLVANDQALLVNESLAELFVLQMAENKLSVNDGMFQQESEDERKKMVQNFQGLLQKFSSIKVDLMEFYLLKSIVLFKSG